MAVIDKAMVRFAGTMLRLKEGTEGQGMAEYGLILALVAVVVVGAVTLLGTNIQTALTNVAGSL